jgi:hypothetical protein
MCYKADALPVPHFHLQTLNTNSDLHFPYCLFDQCLNIKIHLDCSLLTKQSSSNWSILTPSFRDAELMLPF